MKEEVAIDPNGIGSARISMSINEVGKPEWISVGEAACRWGVHQRTVRHWAKAGRIRAWQPGGKGGKIFVSLAVESTLQMEVPHRGVQQCKNRIKIYVRERKDRPGIWRVDVRGGSRGRSTRDFSSEAEARAFAAELNYVAQAKGEVVCDRTVGGMIAGYVRSVELSGVSSKTVKHRREMLAAVSRILGADSKISDIANSESVEWFQNVRRGQVGEATFRHNVWAFRQALRWARGQRWFENVPEIIVPKMPTPRQVWLRSHEITPFLEACSEAFRPLAEAAIRFGLREGAVCVSQAGDFDLSANRLWVQEKPELNWKPKGGRDRGIPLIGRGREIAEEISKRPAGAWSWPTLKGERRVPGTWFSRATKRAAARAGIARDLVYHDLRRTFGAMMIESGASMRAVQVALGHRSIITTENVYAPIANKFVAEQMGKMDQFLATKEQAYQESQPKLPARLRVVK